MKIAVGSDERTPATDTVIEVLRQRGLEVELFGALREGDDPSWPEVARKVAQEVAKENCDQGVLFCWTGTGVSMAANKVAGARAALCTDASTAAGARKWNDANVLCMSLRLTTPTLATEILDSWFSSSPDGSEKGNIEHLKALDAFRIGVS